jgi:hypothetical protein
MHRDPHAVKAWEAACRQQQSFATKLRLTTRSRIGPKQVGSKAAGYKPSYYDYMDAMKQRDDDGLTKNSRPKC